MAELVALFRDELYVVRSDGLVINLDYTVGVEIDVISGYVITARVALFRRFSWALVVAVVIAGFSAVAHLAFLSASPIWAQM